MVIGVKPVRWVIPPPRMVALLVQATQFLGSPFGRFSLAMVVARLESQPPDQSSWPVGTRVEPFEPSAMWLNIRLAFAESKAIVVV